MDDFIQLSLPNVSLLLYTTFTKSPGKTIATILTPCNSHLRSYPPKQTSPPCKLPPPTPLYCPISPLFTTSITSLPTESPPPPSLRPFPNGSHHNNRHYNPAPPPLHFPLSQLHHPPMYPTIATTITNIIGRTFASRHHKTHSLLVGFVLSLIKERPSL